MYEARCTFCRRFITIDKPGFDSEPLIPMCTECFNGGMFYRDSGVTVQEKRREDDDIPGYYSY